jgi:hypothetical protein
MGAQPMLIQNGIALFVKAHSPAVSGVNKQTAVIVESLEKQLMPVSNVEHIHIVETVVNEQIGEDTHEVRFGDEGEHDYGPFIEYGADDQEAQPVKRPAEEEARRWQGEQYKRLMK